MTRTRRPLLLLETLLAFTFWVTCTCTYASLSIQGQPPSLEKDVRPQSASFLYPNDEVNRVNHRNPRDIENQSNLTLNNTENSMSNNTNFTMSSMFLLEDQHAQLVVFWAGQDVIICLAKDIRPNSTSTLYISRDYGKSYENSTSAFVLEDERFATINRYFNHPKNNGHFLFTDVDHKVIFITEDYGKSFKRIQVPFIPEDILFDPTLGKTIVGLESTTALQSMWVSQDFGRSWSMVQEHINSAAWDNGVLYVERQEPGRKTVVLSSQSAFLDRKDTNVLLSDIEEFEIRDDYMFATRESLNGSMDLLISYQRGAFNKAVFPPEIIIKHFHIADVSDDGQIFVCAIQNTSLSHLYVGNAPLDSNESPKFSLSLERIVFFKPNVTWTDSWLNDVSDIPFVDLHRIEGLRGVYIASQFQTTEAEYKLSMENVITVMTLNQGADWEVIKPPEFNDDGQPIYCQFTGNCSLHISQHLSQLYPHYRAVPLLSKKSAIGIVMGTGTVGRSLKGHLGVYISTNGAITWRQILQGNYLYNFGDFGGVIVAVKMFKSDEPTNEILYSLDEGDTWEKYQFSQNKMRVLGLMTEPGENTTVFFIFGSNVDKHSWILAKVDLKKAFERNCTEDDYKNWSPWDNKIGRDCLLGRKDIYKRRISKSKCYNGKNFIRPIHSTKCICTSADFECDFGYSELRTGIDSLANKNSTKTLRKCIKDQNITSSSEWCKPGISFYNRTKGYRKIPGDSCEADDSTSVEAIKEFLPDLISCPVSKELEFLLVAKRDAVLRIDMNDFSRVENLPIPNIKAAIALDFDVINQTIYWSDVTLDTINRLHMDGTSEPEVIISEGLKSVEGIAFDSISKNLYFIDGTEAKIEVIRTDVSRFGRMRKLLLDKAILDKPRSIVLHSTKGYLFYTDWSSTKPCVGRSEMDGSNPIRIVENLENSNDLRIKWPNGISIDFQTNKLYWVDAFLDHMATADLDGKEFRVFLEKDSRITHPFAVVVFKNSIIWDDWATKSIYFTNKDALEPKHDINLITNNITRLMDLKVYGLSREGKNACEDPNKCSYLCLPKINNQFTCECPDGLIKTNTSACVCPDGKPTKSNGQCENNCNGPNMFPCSKTGKNDTGFCIPTHWRCDGDDDCGLGEDEKDCEEITCSPTQFQCLSDKRCIPEGWKCDQETDCSDDSDEQSCEYPKCNDKTEFSCSNKKCIKLIYVCDGDSDCNDGSDELNCFKNITDCKANEFQCEDPSKKCISKEWQCDGDKDCVDSSDERDCDGVGCPDWKFKCDSGECIMLNWKCDFERDCSDGSDEINCTSTTPIPFIITPDPFEGTNSSQMFTCSTSKHKIPIFWVCDLVPDCEDGSDELGCESSTEHETSTPTSHPSDNCPIDHWKCEDSNTCIWISSVCDGFPDCPGKEDEKSCHESGIGCPEGKERCGMSNVCIDKNKYCDGVSNCPNGADEWACNSTRGSTEKCNSGSFMCDEGICHPLTHRCNKKVECRDETDEMNCKNFEKIYQIEGIDIDQDMIDDSVKIEWWLDSSVNNQKIEFLPSWCQGSSCINSTEWTRKRKFQIRSEDLHPHTKYFVTVYARLNEKVYSPAIYKDFITEEAIPSPPRDIKVVQKDTNTLQVEWKQPFQPNGEIIEYILYVSPPTQPMEFQVRSTNKTFAGFELDSHFQSGVKYTFWVIAKNNIFKSDHSESIEYTFKNDVPQISSLRIRNVSNTSVTIEWDSASKVDIFQVSYKLVSGPGHYPFETTYKVNNTEIITKDLSPSTQYSYSIVPIHENIKGTAVVGTFQTIGKPLPRVDGLKVSIKSSTLDLNWKPVKDDRSSKWEYIIVYGLSPQDIAEKKLELKTMKNSIQIPHLLACENYMVDIAVSGPYGLGLFTEKPVMIRTEMDETAPPKELKFYTSNEELKVKVTWRAPCIDLKHPISYNVTIKELHTNKEFQASRIMNSTKDLLEYEIKDISHGGSYEVYISTSHPKGRNSKSIRFEGPPIPPPQKINLCEKCQPPTLYWEIPSKFPPQVKNKGDISFRVWFSNEKDFVQNCSVDTKSKSYIYHDQDCIGKMEEIRYAAVTILDNEGYESPLSSPLYFQPEIPSPPRDIKVVQEDTNTLQVEWKQPFQPNGEIIEYVLCVSPPTPPKEFQVKSTNKTFAGFELDSHFQSGIKYTFWVIAKNNIFKSDHSESIEYTFKKDVPQISNLRIRNVSNTSVTIEWDSASKVDIFQVSYKLVSGPGHYPFETTYKVNNTEIITKDLSPSTQYSYSIVPIHENIKGTAVVGTFQTIGKPLPRVDGLKVSIKSSTLDLNWKPVKDDRSSKWEYIIVYGLSPQDIAEKKLELKTMKNSIQIPHLLACENYMVDIAVSGPYGLGLFTEKPVMIRTEMDETAPPKELKFYTSNEELKVKVTWRAPCIDLKHPISYNITIKELHTNKEFQASRIMNSTKDLLEYEIKYISYGGSYEVYISTSHPKGRNSKSIRFDGPPIPPPQKNNLF